MIQVKIYNTDGRETGEVTFISDGGTWCDTVVRNHFHDATRILDRYHLSEHVRAAARRHGHATGLASGAPTNGAPCLHRSSRVTLGAHVPQDARSRQPDRVCMGIRRGVRPHRVPPWNTPRLGIRARSAFPGVRIESRSGIVSPMRVSRGRDVRVPALLDRTRGNGGVSGIRLHPRPGPAYVSSFARAMRALRV